MLTPISAAVSRSWKVARMARPSLVLARRRCAPRISAPETAKTKMRSGETDKGPRTTGCVENGVGTLLATPAQQLGILHGDPDTDHHEHDRVDRRATERAQQAALADGPGHGADHDRQR